jgi:hypothetical protein
MPRSSILHGTIIGQMLRVSEHYSKHVIAFVDILGFAHLVEKMDRDPTLIDEIYAVLSRFHEEEISAGFGDWIREGVAHVTAASDSIFFSIGIDEWSKSGSRRDSAWACLSTLESVYWLQRYLLKRGVLTRGGVSFGSLLHHQNIIFGPALVRAYRLESQLALFPRVIVDPQVLGLIAVTAEERVIPFRDRLAAITKRDTDGLTFIDYLHMDIMAVENAPEMHTLFEEIRTKTSTALAAARSDIRVFQKVAWLANYYNESLSRMIDEGVAVLADIQPIQVTLP